ncbi:MAG: permease prefix domain 1-containing protein, partial [Actinomycetota bacterium]|nr:permease prefix domain 1-containing protein [Actinomycetota bacterium]
MPEPGLITGYLDDLDRALRLPRRYRRRVLAEAREHLVDSADHEIESGEPAGQAEATAVARFGPVPVVTAAFHRRWASRAVQTSLLVVAAAALPAMAAQALGSPLFWHLAGGGLRPAGPWPIPVKDG